MMGHITAKKHECRIVTGGSAGQSRHVSNGVAGRVEEVERPVFEIVDSSIAPNLDNIGT